jgi:hypothetical protein
VPVVIVGLPLELVVPSYVLVSLAAVTVIARSFTVCVSPKGPLGLKFVSPEYVAWIAYLKD